MTDQPKTEHIDDDTVIKIDDVSMVFNIASEQLNNLKEYAIAIARHELMFKEFRALQHISLEVKKGDVFGILGTNGSGKSTLLKIIAGVLDPSEGSCTVNGNIAPLIELGAGFDMDLTARENVYLNGALLGYSKKFIDQHFDEIIEFAEVEDFLDMPLKNYSSGMVSRIAFAIATVIVPEILLVDEVLSVGDFMFQKKCENRIKELIEQHGVTVLIVSHSIGQIERLCNKAVWIEKGQMRLLGSADLLCNVYTGIGGRIGSKESEDRLFHLLQTPNLDSIEHRARRIHGSNCFSQAGMLAGAAWEEKPDTVILAASELHLNAVLASGLSKKLDAPVLLTHREEIPTETLGYLFGATPHHIITLDCGSYLEDVIQQAQSLPWSPQVTNIERSGDTLESSCEVLKYGIEHQLWGDVAVIGDIADRELSIFFSTYMAKHAAPFLCTWADGWITNIDAAISLLTSGGFRKVLFIGEKGTDEQMTACQNAGLQVEKVSDTAPYLEEIDEHTTKIDLVAPDPTQAEYLLASGCFAAKTHAITHVLDSNNLDSMVGVLDLIKNSQASIAQVDFIGPENAFFSTDYLLVDLELDKKIATE